MVRTGHASDTSPAASLRRLTREAVLRAVEEYDRLGRDAFLATYHFGRAREYYLLLNGIRYDSKAIAGVAHKYVGPNGQQLFAGEFAGGERTVRKALQQLGFTVVRGRPGESTPEALVLVENEVTFDGDYDFWADETGSRYHYPNIYKNMVQAGTPFVYYRGVRRANNKRGTAEYFGTGVIGDIWPDPSQPADTPKKDQRWYCSIEQYVPFEMPVPAKSANGPYEQINTARGWGRAVRPISLQTLDAIRRAGESHTGVIETGGDAAEDMSLSPRDLSEVVIRRPKTARGGVPSKREPRRTKEIGDWAEEAVFRWLTEHLTASEVDSLDWHAQRGDTPGWDISYRSTTGDHIAIEVKATTAHQFSAVEITGNEWRAAEASGEHYRIALVTGAMTSNASITFISDPYNALADLGMAVEPLNLRLTWTEGVSEDAG